MSPTPPFAVAQLKQLVYYHLDNESLDNANFLAGRLHAIDPRNPDSAHLLALTYHRLRRSKAAHDFSQKFGANGKHLGCAFVYALACQDLGKYPEAINALEKARNLWLARNNWGKHTETSRRHLPDAPAVNALLGNLWRAHGDARRAADCYVEAHKANPLTWDAFQGLCDIGADIDISSSFRLTPDMASAFSAPAPELSSFESATEDPQIISAPLAQQNNPNHQNLFTPSNDPFSAPPRPAGDVSAANFLLPRLKSKGTFANASKAPAQSSWDTPTANGAPGDDDIEMGGESLAPADEPLPPAAPQRRTAKATLQRLGFDTGKDPSRMRAAQMRTQVKPTSESTDNEESAAAVQARRAQSNHKRTISGHASHPTAQSDADNHNNNNNASQPRRSNRLFSQITGSKNNATRGPAESSSIMAGKREDAKKVRATGVKGRGTSTVGRVVSGNRKVMPPNPSDKEPRAPNRNSAAPSIAPQRQPMETTSLHDHDVASLECLMTTFRSLGAAYYSLSRFSISSAIEGFKGLPAAQRETPWVLSQLGKAYYEAADYSNAESCFAKMVKLQPTHITETEVYSNVLWQLKKPVQLSFLAHTLRDLEFNAPQTWCAVGNAFSLNREHEQAIACFRRATQVDPGFSYAWTLMGHELLTNEEFDAALSAFRKGVGSERRGYGAWYGLGKCYERMGKWEEAERHYRIAASINPSNSVLAVCIGVVLEKLRHPKAALTQYTHALSLAPNSSLAHFKKARVLLNLRLYPDALVELEALKNLAAEEANVWFLLGKCHKGLGQRAASVRAYTTALNLDPKAAQYIKEAMESLDDSDDSDDDMDDD